VSRHETENSIKLAGIKKGKNKKKTLTSFFLAEEKATHSFTHTKLRCKPCHVYLLQVCRKLLSAAEYTTVYLICCRVKKKNIAVDLPKSG